MDKRNTICTIIFFISIGTVFSQTDSLKIQLATQTNEVQNLIIPDASNNTSVNNETQIQESGLFTQLNLTGSWWGLRDKILTSGIQLNFCYKGEGFSNVFGGLEHKTKFLDNYDVQMNVNMEKLFDFSGTELFVYVLGNSGSSIDEMIGTSQGITNIEAFSTWKLYEFLIKKTFYDNKLSFYLGLYDFNSEFDSRETSGLFINPSHGVGPDISSSGVNGPSIFPTTSLGFRIKYETDDFYLQGALLDGVPGDPDNPIGTHVLLRKDDGYLLATEIGITEKSGDKLGYKVGVGFWEYSTPVSINNYDDFGLFTSLVTERNFGIYLTAEKSLTDIREAGSNISLFFRTGLANATVNPIDFYVGGGINYRGLIKGREDDEFGIAVAYAHNSDSYRRVLLIEQETEIKSSELNIEGTYSFKLTPWFTIQPDIQYFVNPAFCTEAKNSFLIGSRMILNF